MKIASNKKKIKTIHRHLSKIAKRRTQLTSLLPQSPEFYVRNAVCADNTLSNPSSMRFAAPSIHRLVCKGGSSCRRFQPYCCNFVFVIQFNNQIN